MKARMETRRCLPLTSSQGAGETRINTLLRKHMPGHQT